MQRPRHTPEQIVRKLREAGRLLAETTWKNRLTPLTSPEVVSLGGSTK